MISGVCDVRTTELFRGDRQRLDKPSANASSCQWGYLTAETFRMKRPLRSMSSAPTTVKEHVDSGMSFRVARGLDAVRLMLHVGWVTEKIGIPK